MKTRLPYDEVREGDTGRQSTAGTATVERKEERKPEALEAKGNITVHAIPASPVSTLIDERETKRIQPKNRRVFHSDDACSSFMISARREGENYASPRNVRRNPAARI
jgi:hypothetical protein